MDGSTKQDKSPGLKRRVVLIPESMTSLWVILLLLAVAPLLIVAVTLLELSPSSEALSEAWSEVLSENWDGLLAGVALLLMTPLFFVYQQRSRLLLDQTGIVLNPDLPGLLASVGGKWRLRWEEIERAVLTLHPKGNAVQLVLFPHQGRRRILLPAMWRLPHESARGIPLRIRRISEQEITDLRRDAALLRILSEAGIIPEFEARLHQTNLPGSDLTQSPRALIVVGMMVLLGGYALAEGGFIRDFQFAGAVPWLPIAVIAMLVGLFALSVLHVSHLSQLEKAGLVLLVSASATAAAYAGLPRWSGGEPMTHLYEVQADGILVAINPTLPNLIRPVDDAFWHNQASGSRHDLILWQTPLGFWVLDRRPILKQVQEWYQRQ